MVRLAAGEETALEGWTLLGHKRRFAATTMTEAQEHPLAAVLE
jgi:hypothetical protein